MTSPRNSNTDAWIPARPGSFDELIEPFLPGREKPLLAIARSLRETLLALGNEATPATELQAAWWHDEIRRLAAGEPRHPLTRPLAAAVAAGTLDPGLLTELLVAAESRRAGQWPDSAESLRLDLFRRHAVPLQIAAAACAGTAAETAAVATAAKHTGIAYGYLTLAAASADAVHKSGNDGAAPAVSPGTPEACELGLRDIQAVTAAPWSGIAVLDLYRALTAEGLKRRGGGRTMSRFRLLWIAWRTARASRRARGHDDDGKTRA
ncbi:MAG: hypothetical protein AAFX58_02420 [Pseudomonadota bacterium]